MQSDVDVVEERSRDKRERSHLNISKQNVFASLKKDKGCWLVTDYYRRDCGRSLPFEDNTEPQEPLDSRPLPNIRLVKTAWL